MMFNSVSSHERLDPSIPVVHQVRQNLFILYLKLQLKGN